MLYFYLKVQQNSLPGSLQRAHPLAGLKGEGKEVGEEGEREKGEDPNI